MGTTLTGTTPQDTYDSLIKVTDNGPLSGTAKYLSDGLGNDSKLALSTSKVFVNTTTSHGTLTIEQPVSESGLVVNSSTASAPTLYLRDAGGAGYSEILANNKLYINAGNVGIGTSNPTRQLSISATNPQMVLKSTTTTGFSELYFGDTAADNGYVGYAHNGDYMYFGTNNSEKLRILSSGGITFNGDTAAANALDDYEEGTFTPTFAGGLTGVTYSTRYGSYTKIGNRVMFDIRIQASAVSGSSGNLLIGGLPFATNGTVISNATIGYFGVYTTDIVYCLIDANTTNAILFYKKDATPLLGSELTADTSAIHLSGVYFV